MRGGAGLIPRTYSLEPPLVSLASFSPPCPLLRPRSTKGGSSCPYIFEALHVRHLALPEPKPALYDPIKHEPQMQTTPQCHMHK